MAVLFCPCCIRAAMWYIIKGKTFVKVYKPGIKKSRYLVKLAGGKNLDNRGMLVVR